MEMVAMLLHVSWSLAYFHPQLVNASQCSMQKGKTTSGYSIMKVLSLCKHFITLTAVPPQGRGIHLKMT